MESTGARSVADWAKRFDLARAAFWITIAFGIFITGGVFSSNNLQPYQIFEDGYIASRELIKQQLQSRHDMVEEIRYAGDGVIRYDKARAYFGLTLIQGEFPEGVEIRLLDMSGNIVRRWPARFYDIWPEPSHVMRELIPATDHNYHTQGMWLLPDGAVVFSMTGFGTVKMDKCGTVQWTVDRTTHHSITPVPDGSFWIPVRGDPHEVPEDLLLKGFSPKTPAETLRRYEDRLMLVSADGKIMQEMSVLRALVEGDFHRELFDTWSIDKSDPTHINDIEVVTAPLAKKIVGVHAGDLLVSIRQLHMLAIFDRVSGRIKWHQTGPWVRQHDPDITEHGTIEVFNNGGHHLNSDRFRGSSIMVLDPGTGKTKTLYPLADDSKFYSKIMGTHQLLPNGNRLIVESMAGRVFEIDEKGEIVWDYVKPYDESHATVIESAVRYDMDYFSTQDWSCSRPRDSNHG